MAGTAATVKEDASDQEAQMDVVDDTVVVVVDELVVAVAGNHRPADQPPTDRATAAIVNLTTSSTSAKDCLLVRGAMYCLLKRG